MGKLCDLILREPGARWGSSCGQLAYVAPRVSRHLHRECWLVYRRVQKPYGWTWERVPPDAPFEPGTEYRLTRQLVHRPLASVLGSRCLRAAPTELDHA